MTPKRLLAITHDFSATGAPIALFNGLTGLTEQFDILVVSPVDGPLRADYLAAGITALVTPRVITDANVVANLLLSHDVLLANTIISCIPIHAASQVNKPSLWYIHEGHVGVHFLKQYEEMKSAFPLATCLGCPSRFTQNLYKPWRGEERAELIPYGVKDQEDYDQGDPKRPLWVLQLGTFEPRKGQDIALAAFQMLQGRDIHFSMIGQIVDRGFHKQVMSGFRELGRDCHLPPVPREKISELMACYDVLIVPSRDETTPVVILEAMALGKTVIASKICGIPEMIVHGETGLLFEPGNAAHLATLLGAVASEPDVRKRLGENARNCQRQQWSLDKYRKRLGEVLASLVDGATPPDEREIPAPNVVVQANAGTYEHTPLPGAPGERGRGEGPPPNTTHDSPLTTHQPNTTHDSPLTTHHLPPGDYVSANLPVVLLDHAFPNMMLGDTRRSTWPYLRRNIPHNWYVDRRNPTWGFVSRDEAHILYHTALQFAGKNALEIGCWTGWSAAHLALGGVQLDVIDFMLDDSSLRAQVAESLTAVEVMDRVNLVTGRSPERVESLAAETRRQWSLIFIDGDHEGTAPLRDVKICATHAAPDAMILMHDLAAPAVAVAFNWLRAHGWNTMLYETMQIMGVAWRGNVKPIEHVPDPSIPQQLPGHLEGYQVSR